MTYDESLRVAADILNRINDGKQKSTLSQLRRQGIRRRNLTTHQRFVFSRLVLDRHRANRNFSFFQCRMDLRKAHAFFEPQITNLQDHIQPESIIRKNNSTLLWASKPKMWFRAHRGRALFVAQNDVERFIETNDKSLSMLADFERIVDANRAGLYIGSKNYSSRRSLLVLHVTEPSTCFRDSQKISNQDEEVQRSGKELGRIVSRGSIS